MQRQLKSFVRHPKNDFHLYPWRSTRTLEFICEGGLDPEIKAGVNLRISRKSPTEGVKMISPREH